MTNLIIMFGVGVIVGAALGAIIMGLLTVSALESRIEEQKGNQK